MTELRKELLAASEVWMLLGMSRSTFYDFIRDDASFPRPVLLGKRKVRKWLREEVEWYIRLRPRGEQPQKPDAANR